MKNLRTTFMKKTLITCLLILLGSWQLMAQTVSVQGKIQSTGGEALPFANVYLKNTTTGTTTNENGLFQLNLVPGKYELVFQYIGYQTQTQVVQVDDVPIILEITLASESVTLEAIEVSPDAEDPAYAIIRKAIDKRKEYLREIESYRCEAYLKGLQRLDKAPERILGQEIDLDTGVVYLSESISTLSFRQPDQYKEEMKSSKVSGDSQGFSFNQASEMDFNLYENLIPIETIEKQFLVSPISNSALLYYDYEWLGLIQEGNLQINKIKIIPKSKSSPTISGTIYILEDSWRIYASEIFIADGKIDFMKAVSIQQSYAPIGESWALISQKFAFSFGALGFIGSGYFVCLYQDYELDPNFPKNYFNNALLVVEEGANEKDSLYWKDVRPIPLTNFEIEDYQTKDSLEIVKKSESYLDSLDRATNKLSYNKIMLSGYEYQNSFQKTRWQIAPVAEMLQFNSIEGWVLNAPISYQKSWEDRRKFTIAPTLRYGFSNEEFQGKLKLEYNFKPQKFARISLEGGRFVEQLSRFKLINPLINTSYALWEKQNYMKLYQKAYGKVALRYELLNGLLLFSNLEYAERQMMQNTSDYSLRPTEHREYTSNQPTNLEISDTSVPTHQALTWEVYARFRFDQEYLLYPDQKYNTDSKYPTLWLKYRKGIPILGSDIDYDWLALSVNDEFTMGLLGTSKWQIEVGIFFNNEELYFMDFRHFWGNQTFIKPFQEVQGLGDFQLLPYYESSTQDQYFKAHYEHHFNGFIWRKLPLLKKLKWQTLFLANYLTTPVFEDYWEIGVGIEHIFKVMRVDYVWSFQENIALSQGLRIGVGF